MICECRLIDCHTDAILVQGVDSGEAVHVSGPGGIWEISMLSAQFFYQPENIGLLKKKRNEAQI